MSNELKLCPFCGEAPEINQVTHPTLDKLVFAIDCVDMGCVFTRFYGEHDRVNTVVRWNTRHMGGKEFEEIEAMRKEACYFIRTLTEDPDKDAEAWAGFDERLAQWWKRYGHGDIKLIGFGEQS